jgi:hypothetical protein
MHEGLKRQGVAIARPFQQTLEWYGPGVEELGQGRLTLFGFWIVRLAQGEENESVAMARLSLPSSMAENFSIRGHETRTN